MSLEIYSSKGEQLLINEGQCIKGLDKYVYQALDGSEKVAVKVFKRNDEYEDPIYNSRQERINNELKAYALLLPSPLAPYIPKFRYRLVDERGVCIGIGVNWEDGIIVDKMTENVIPKEEIERFKSKLFETIDSGVLPYTDMIFGHNIAFNKERSPMLWLTECELEGELDEEHFNKKWYLGWIRSGIAELKEHSAL